MKRDTYYAKEQPEEQAAKFEINNIKRLIKYAIPYKKIFILVFFLVVTTSVLSLIPNLILRDIINKIIPEKDLRKLYLTVGGFLILCILQVMLPWLYGVLLRVRTDEIIREMRREFFNKLQELSFDFFDTRPAGKIFVCIMVLCVPITLCFFKYFVETV